MQLPDHNARATFLRALAPFLCVVLTCLAGCESRGAGAHRSPHGQAVPDWLNGLREPLQDLPSRADVDPGSMDPASSRQRVGTPTELGSRLDAPTPVTGRTNDNGSAPPRAGSRLALPSEITVNLRAPNADVPTPIEPPVVPSALEQLYRGNLPERPDRALEQFGYRQLARLAAPVGSIDAPASGDHVLAIGDELVVDLTTDQVERFRAAVEPDGSVELEGLLAMQVAGLRFADVQRAVRDEVARVRRNFELTVRLGRLAAVPVRVVGEAEAPGVVELGPRPTLLDALGVAGVRRSGSLRRLTIIRSNGERQVIDAYGYLLGRDEAPDIRLFRGDTVSIPPIGRTVAVAGAVQRPGIFELLDDDITAAGAIDLTGGRTGFALAGQVQIERTVGNGRVLIDVEDDGRQTTMRDGDLLLVGAVDGRLHPIVEAQGELARPGRFQFREGMTVGDLVRLSGGLTADAYDRQAIISRVAGASALRGEAWDAQPTPTARRVLVVDLQRALRGVPEHDVLLEPLDFLRVARFDDARALPTVEVIGAARRPGLYELTAGMAVADLIAIAGHLEPDAFRDEAELVRRRRTDDATVLDVDRYRIPLAPILSGASPGPQLASGDRLILRTLTRAEVRVRADGLVRFPGEYVLPAGSRITDLIAAAGGVLEGADMRAAVFSRQAVRERQLRRWDDLAERTRQTFERNLEQRVNSARSKEAFSARIQLQQVQSTLERLRRSQVTGRIVLPFESPQFPELAANLVLEPGDALRVPRSSNTVTVQGHVFNPTTVVFDAGVTADDLLTIAGGMTEIADKDRLYVVRASGRVASVEQRFGRFRLGDPLRPGDVVLVPPRPLGRDAGSVMLDVLLLARTAGEAAALWNLATSDIDDGSLSIIDTPASPRNDSTPPSELLREFQR